MQWESNEISITSQGTCAAWAAFYGSFSKGVLTMKRSLRLLPVIALMAAAACNTVAGAGRDLSAAGQAVNSEARETQAKM